MPQKLVGKLWHTVAGTPRLEGGLLWYEVLSLHLCTQAAVCAPSHPTARDS